MAADDPPDQENQQDYPEFDPERAPIGQRGIFIGTPQYLDRTDRRAAPRPAAQQRTRLDKTAEPQGTQRNSGDPGDHDRPGFEAAPEQCRDEPGRAEDRARQRPTPATGTVTAQTVQPDQSRHGRRVRSAGLWKRPPNGRAGPASEHYPGNRAASGGSSHTRVDTPPRRNRKRSGALDRRRPAVRFARATRVS